MTESFDPVHGAFLGLDQDLTRSLSSFDVIGFKLSDNSPKRVLAMSRGGLVPSSLTCSVHSDRSSPRQNAIQYP